MSLQERYDAPRRRERKPQSLFRFLTDNGGLKPCGDLNAILDGSHGWMIRSKGKTLDRAREACVEAGYLKDVSWNDGCSTSTIRDLLELIDAEARGFKQYPNDYAPDPDFDPDYEAYLQDNCGGTATVSAAAAPCHAFTERGTERMFRPQPRKAKHMAKKPTMTPAQFKKALDQLGLVPYSAAPLLEMSVRTIYRITAGEYPVPDLVARYLRLCIKHKVDPREG